MTNADQSRRSFLRAIGVAVATVVAGRSAIAQTQAASPSKIQGSRVSRSKLTAFRLVDVRLLAGPFLDAQRRDEKYLLLLEPDRLLHNFRVNAGLQPKGAVYGGWESQEPWVEIRCHGHTL